MKSSQYPIWKRLASFLLVLILCLSTSGPAAFAEEFLLWDEAPAEASYEPELFEELIEDETGGDYLLEEPILIEDAFTADNGVLDEEELFPESTEDMAEAAPEQAFPADETAVPDAQPQPETVFDAQPAPKAVLDARPQPEAVPGAVRLAAGEELFPAGASLSVTPLPAAEAAEPLMLDDSARFDSAEAEGEGGSDDEVPDDLIYDEAIPDGDEVLLVNPRRASDVSANCSVTTETVASYRYEISMLSPEGEALQPPEGERVTLAFDLPEASDESLDVKVLHLPASGAQEELPARVEGGTVYAETAGFSAFVVEFTRTERRYTATSSVPTPVKNIVDSVVTEEKNLFVVYVSSSHPNLVKAYKDMDIWFVEAPWVFDETVTLTVGTSPWEGDVSPTAEYTITVKSHLPGVPYRKLGESLECTKYTLMSTIKEQMGMTLKDGWYVVDKDVTFEKHRLTVLGDVHLILRDGCTLTCKYGIRTATKVDPKTALTVYAEDKGTGLLRCEVNYDRGTRESFYAGIGGNRSEDCGVITVYGGEIKAVGAIQGSGIGGGTDGNLRGFTMYDGSVTVKGKKGAGLGGGKGGTITGPIAIHGGLLTAKSLSTDQQDPINYSAAVGAGEDKNLGADIIIDGGVVIAHASNGGPGIGDSGITSGGKRVNDNGVVTIKGGHVIASATDGAGIGAGMNGIERGGTGCTVNISDGYVEAVSSKRGAGIGGSYKGNGGVVNISGGYVVARGTDLQVPFGHGHKWITSEKQSSAARAGLEAVANLLIEAFSRHEYGGAGIGGGDGGNGGTVTISGGTVLAASGGNGSQGIGHGMEGESNGTATITDDYARIQYGTSMDKLNESKRKDVYGWNNITREKRSHWLTNNAIVYIFPCEHEEMVYRKVDRDYHEHVCQTCLYYERAEAHDFDEKGICRKCLYNRNDKPVEYDVWYLGIRVTSENMERMHFDPFTKTLTVPQNVDWNLSRPLYNDALIYAEGDLNITGNAWVSPKDNPAKYGVYVKGGTVTFKADSNLSFTAGNYGIYAPNGLKIENVKALGFTAGEGGTGVYFGDKPPVVDENVALKTPEYGKAGSGAIVDKDGKNAAAVNFVRGLTLSFDASGAADTPAPMKGLVKNREYTLPEGKPRRQNYDFLDWNIAGTLFDAGMSFAISEDTTATAVWQEHAHNWKAPVWEWKQDESGRMLATAQFVCSECNEFTQAAASVFASTTEASCEKPGSIRYLASVRAFGGDNGEYNDTKIVTLPALGHKWGEWTVTKEATTEDPGEMMRVCANDSTHVEHKLIPQLHTHSLIKLARVEPVCVREGNIECWMCTGCGEYFADAEGKTPIEKESVILPATGRHQPEATTTVTQEATCTERREYQYRVRCKDCGQLLEGRNGWDFPLGHDWGDWTVTKEATETQEGEESRVCRRDPSHVETRIIPKKAHVHNLSETEAAAASCTEPGNIAYWTCAGCGRLFADNAGTREITRSETVIEALGHKAEDEWTVVGVTKQPACTEQGAERVQLKCARCGEVLSTRDRTIPSLGHDWGAWETISAATEDKEGSEQRVCAHDESHIETRAIPRKPHEHSLQKIAAAEPACTAPGNIEYWTCLGCGRRFADAEGKNEIEEADTVIPATGHHAEDEWTEAVVTAATCLGTGRKELTLFCRDCREILSSRSVGIPALGHDWGDWTVTKEATETQEGEESRVCRRDPSHVETRIIPKKAHVHNLSETEAAAASCTEPGNIAYWTCAGCGRLFADNAGTREITRSETVIEALGHKAEDEWTVVGVTKQPACTEQGVERVQLKCARCGEVMSTRDRTIPALGHDWSAWTVTKAATETQEGSEQRVCAHDESHIETRAIPRLQHVHSLQKTAAAVPACTAPGNSEYWKCLGCGRYFADAEGKNEINEADTVIPANGHTAENEWSEKVVVGASCLSTGRKELTLFCRDCREILSIRSVSIPALGHDWGEWTETKAATETDSGIETRTCTRCARTEERVIPKLEHIHYLEKMEAAAPSCTESGNIAYWMCENCGLIFSDENAQHKTNYENIVIPALGHSAEEIWRPTGERTDPDCTTPGEESFERCCSRCGRVIETKTEIIPATGHLWGAWETISAATETQEGSEQRVCAHDESHIETRAIPRKPHEHSLQKTAAAKPTCTATGNIEYWTCLGCGRRFADAAGKNEIEEADTVIPANGHTAETEWSETLVIEAGCLGTGRKELTLFCGDCGEILSTRSVSIPAPGHDWGAWTETKAATEKDSGIETRTCARCARTEERVIPKLEHRHDLAKTEAAAPSCTESGNIAYWTCLGCGLIFSDENAQNETNSENIVIPALGHSAEETWRSTGKRTEPDCTTPGEEDFERLCTRCGKVADTKTEIIPATGHFWGAWETISAATEDKEGSEQRVCAHDASHTEQRVIPRKPHEHRLTKTEAAEPGCDTPGNIEYWTCLGCGRIFADAEGKNEITEADTVIPATGRHTPKAEWDPAGSLAPACETEGLDSYERHCAVCGALLETRTERVPALGHAWGAWTVTKAATEEDSGLETRTCARCGKAEQHDIPKLAHRHSMTKVAAVEPTCTETGSIAYYHCSACGRLFADAAGKNEIYESDILLPAKGHRSESGWQFDAITKEPGCTDQGFKRMKLYCSDCGEELSTRGESIAPIGHDWGDWETVLEPTETQEGRQVRVCLNDERHVEERALPILTHTHTLTEIPGKEARCVEPGSRACYQCTGCGLYFADAAGTQPVEPEDMVIEALGHTAGAWSEGTVEKNAACTEIGIRSYTLSCARCGETLTTRTERIPALGHAWGEWVTDIPATEDAEGSEIRICAHDEKHIETRTTPRLPHIHHMEKVPGKAPGCVDPGSIEYWTCTGCGRFFSDAEGKTEIGPDDLILPPKGHRAAEEWVSEKEDPDCTTPGYARFTLHCVDCGEILSTRGSAIPALGHAWGAWETVKAPTEAEDGEEQRICLRDPAHVQTRVIPALGHTHTMTLVPEKAAGCTKEGSRAYYLCSGCGLCFEDEQGENWIAPEDTVIAPLGHRAGAWKEESRTAPGCTQPGVKTLALHCAACDTVLTTRSEIIPARGHDWGSATYLWSDDLSIVIAERLCRNDPSHMQQEICDEIEIETAVPALCEDEGTELYRAVFENPAFDSERTRAIPAIGHKWGAWTVTRAATETEDGEQTRICENDSAHVQTAVIPSITHVHKLTAVPEKKPGCTEEGNIAYWICESCESIFTDAEGENEVDPALEDSIFLPPLGHDWQQDGEAVWTDDHYSALLHFVCRRDRSHTREVLAEAQTQPEIKLPTKEADGSVISTVSADFEGKTYTEQRSDPIARPGYTYTEETKTWTRGSGKSAVFRVVRGDGSDDLNDDKLTMTLFTGIEIDGKSVAAENYSAGKGSVIVTLKSAYLETLSLGEHSLTTNFGDGAVTTRFLVSAEPDVPTIPPTTPPTVPPTTPPTVPPTTPPAVPPTLPPTIPPTLRPSVPSTVRPGVFPAYPDYVDYDPAYVGTRTSVYQPTTAPRTGDESKLGFWCACTLVSGTLALCCAQGMRRRRKGRDEDKAS